MKKLSQFVVEGKELNLQDDIMGFASADAIKEYLQKADRFLSVEAKEVCNWLIANNKTYMKDFGGLDKFYAKGAPKDPSLKALYKNIGVLSKKNQLMQIPVFQTEEQFDDIISGKVSPDEVFIDLTSQAGRNKVAKQYEPLCHKIARSFAGKSNFSYDDLLGYAMEGLTWAMNSYGKSSKETKKKKDTEGIDMELEKEARKATTFLTYASYMIRISIIEHIKTESHLVRIPVSVQNQERRETGRNTKSKSNSGDEPIGKGDDKGKSLFDFMDGDEDADKSLDKQDVKKLWKGIQAILNKNFNEKTLDVFYSMNGLFGHEKMKAKEIMAKYGMKNPSEVSNSNWKVLHFIKTDKTMRKAFAELYSLYKECLNDEDRRSDRNILMED